jgi:peroxiredoxin
MDASRPACLHRAVDFLHLVQRTSIGGAPVHAQAKFDMAATIKPAEALLSAIEVASRAAEALTASGVTGQAVKAGTPAPGFNLHDADGEAVSLCGALANGPAIVTFHGGLWCPTCITELQALEAARPEFERHSATLLAISPQTPSHNRPTRDEIGRSFPLLADPRSRVASAYGVLAKLPSVLIDLYQRSGIDLPSLNGDESRALPLPARFVVAPDRTILYSEVSPDFTRRFDPLDLLPVLRTSSRPFNAARTIGLPLGKRLIRTNEGWGRPRPAGFQRN